MIEVFEVFGWILFLGGLVVVVLFIIVLDKKW